MMTRRAKTPDPMQEAANALVSEGHAHGFIVHTDGDMVTVCTALNQPFYKIKLIPYTSNGKNRFRYDVGREIVSTPNLAILKVCARRLI